tara:strand:+ start:214 stop:576 length:363 start_codon:yes stop_codon:yes gene_type:complete
MNIILALTLGALPLAPTREPIVGECLQAYPMAAGQSPNEDFVDPSTWLVTCGAVAIPTSQVAWLLETAAWADGAAGIYAADVMGLEAALAIREPNGAKWWTGAATGALAGFAIGALLWGR